MIVKICANTNREDILLADQAGADIIGVVVEIKTSRRWVDRAVAERLFAIPTHADKAMLLCNHSLDETIELVRTVKPYIVHLTGTEPPEFVEQLRKRARVKVLKSLHLPAEGTGNPGGNNYIEWIKAYAESGVQCIVLDTSDPSRKMFGGTGLKSDWSAAAQIVAESALPVLLAGGISPDNVVEAIEKVRPHGIDLASGVEEKIGVKDPVKVRLLIERVRKCPPK